MASRVIWTPAPVGEGCVGLVEEADTPMLREIAPDQLLVAVPPGIARHQLEHAIKRCL
jgi:hypothetical protein